MRTLLLLLAVFVGLSLPAQICDYGRYRDAIFDVDTLTDVVYGNAPAMPAVYIAENVTVPQDMTMDIYLPRGDTLSRRPAFLFAFGGGFLLGSKEDEDARSICDSMARKGYVAASINYRLNLNVANGNSAERAVWRAVQDWSAAIRYIKEYADSLRIDTNWVFSGGVSAGSISGMHLQYATDSQRPAATYQLTFPPAPDLGCKDCEGNNYQHLSSVRALVNCWGAIGDTLWIDAQDSVPMISFHGDLDPVVPYGFGFPFTALLTMPRVYGSSLIAMRQDHLGMQNQFIPFPGEGHNVWGTVVSNEFVPGPTVHWQPILEDIRDFLWGFLQTQTGLINGNNTVAQNDIVSYSVPWQAKHSWCWEVTGGTIVSANPASNTVDVRWDQQGTGLVKAQAMRHLDAEGEEQALLVNVGPVGLDEKDTEWSVGPNPASEWLYLQRPGGGAEAWSWELLDAQGRKLSKGKAEEHQKIAMPAASGRYFLRLVSEEGSRVWPIVRM